MMSCWKVIFNIQTMHANGIIEPFCYKHFLVLMFLTNVCVQVTLPYLFSYKNYPFHCHYFPFFSLKLRNALAIILLSQECFIKFFFFFNSKCFFGLLHHTTCPRRKWITDIFYSRSFSTEMKNYVNVFAALDVDSSETYQLEHSFQKPF